MTKTLDQLSLEDVLGAEGVFARKLAGYEPRQSQREMAELVLRALEHGGVSLVEAGTGTGKTFAYLVPALLSGARVVVSTGTRALQDQIALRDVPALETLLDETLPVAVLKGLSNYVCQRRLAELLASAESVSRPEIVRHLPVLQAFAQSSPSGERRELPEVPDDAPIWAAVESGSDTRVGPRCRFYESCFVTRARLEAQSAQVVVVNHHLFFADLALRARGASVIPPYDAVIFDEAHQIGDVMTDFFGLSIGAGRVDRLVREADRTLAALRLDSELSEHLLRKVLLATSDLVDALASPAVMGSAVSSSAGGAVGVGTRQGLGSREREALRDHLFDLEAALEAAGAHVRAAIDPEERAHDVLHALVGRIEELRNDLLVVVEGGHGLVVWVEGTRARRGAVIGASPVDVSRHFREEVLERTRTVVLTSATLQFSTERSSTDRASTERSSRAPSEHVEPIVVPDDAPPEAPSPSPAGLTHTARTAFAFTRRELGIEGEVDELVLASPFDYAEQAALYLPKLPDPREPGFTALARQEIEALVTASGGGAFVLTTSLRVLDDLSRTLAPTLRRRGLTTLVQGEHAKHTLLERFRADGHAVLFATLGFWEGVDVPGQALRLVVLDRVPFEVPSDPLVRARCERLEEEGGSAFKDYLLPSAALTLRQGFGRLVRTRADRGLVAILDGRLRTKGYGKLLLRSLPDARRLTQRAEALAFLASLAR